MPTTLIIIDDFLDDPYAFRQAGLKLTYPEVVSPYPGRNSLQRIHIEGLTEEVSKIVGEPLKSMEHNQSHGKFRISCSKDVGTAKVHVDPSHWSGVLYLSEPESEENGTDFFRHIPTNTERTPYNDEECLQRFGSPSAKTWVKEILDRDSNDDSKWELIHRVPMRFNRLILFRPWLWHTAGKPFGESIYDGRLVYLMFFQSIRK
jgi:hypothetical protein